MLDGVDMMNALFLYLWQNRYVGYTTYRSHLPVL